MAGIGPVTGYGGTVVPYPEASPAEQFGGPVDPRHARPLLEDPFAYPWEAYPAIPYAAPEASGMTGGHPEPLPAGTGAADPALDLNAPTATRSHAAPWPALSVADSDGGVETYQRAAQVSAEIHGIRMQSGNARLYGDPAPPPPPVDHFQYNSEGVTNLAGAMPKQLRGLRGLDSVQGFAPQNSYGFGGAGVFDRKITSGRGLLGYRFWMKPGGRPMVIQPVGGDVRQGTGPGSPFAGQDPAAVYGTQGAVLQVPQAQPSYSPAPDPYVAPAYPGGGESGWSEW